MPHVWYDLPESNEKVAKNDGAETCISFWNGRISSVLSKQLDSTYDILRKVTLIVYRRKLFKEFLGFLHSKAAKVTALALIKQRGGAQWGFMQKSQANYSIAFTQQLNHLRIKGVEAITRAINITSIMEWSQ